MKLDPTDSVSTEQTLTIPAEIPRHERRNIGVWLPVYTRVSHTCQALGVSLQQVATQELNRWQKRNARKARLALAKKSQGLG